MSHRTLRRTWCGASKFTCYRTCHYRRHLNCTAPEERLRDLVVE